MTPGQLASLGVRIDRAVEWAPHVGAAMVEFAINTTARQAAFIAQCLHESGMLRYTTEIWGPTAAQSRYEGRRDLGNTSRGDGLRFCGRGILQITGRANYKQAGDALNVDLIASPEMLSTPTLACRSAGWYWHSHGLNELADAGDFARITLRINGGTNGLKDRLALHAAALKILCNSERKP